MKSFSNFNFVIILLLLNNSYIYSETNKTNKINSIILPSASFINAKKVLLNYDSRRTFLLGDGFSCKIIEGYSSEINYFIKNINETNDFMESRWFKYPIAKSFDDKKIIEWLMGWAKIDKIAKKINAIINVKELIVNENIYYKTISKYQNTDKKDITDAWMWIIIPNKNIIIYLNCNT